MYKKLSISNLFNLSSMSISSVLVFLHGMMTSLQYLSAFWDTWAANDMATTHSHACNLFAWAFLEVKNLFYRQMKIGITQMRDHESCYIGNKLLKIHNCLNRFLFAIMSIQFSLIYIFRFNLNLRFLCGFFLV